MILPKIRDPRFITIRRGGTLTDADHRLLALWAAVCAEHVLPLFESVKPSDPRPRHAIEQIRTWARGEITMTESRSAGGHAMAAARGLTGGAPPPPPAPPPAGEGADRSGSPRRVRRRPGCGGGPCRRPRARGRRLRHQGGPGGRPGRGGG